MTLNFKGRCEKNHTNCKRKIYFKTGSAKLKPVSSGQLDALVEILKRYEAADLTIEGHTDDVGKDDFNMDFLKELSRLNNT